MGISVHRDPFGEPGGDSLAGTVREKGSISRILFLDPEDFKILGNVV